MLMSQKVLPALRGNSFLPMQRAEVDTGGNYLFV